MEKGERSIWLRWRKGGVLGLDSLLLEMGEPQGIAEVFALVVNALEPAHGRTCRLDGGKEPQLGKDAQSDGEKDKVGAGIQDNLGPGLEDNKVKICFRKGVCCRQPNRAAADDDCFEGLGSHLW